MSYLSQRKDPKWNRLLDQMLVLEMKHHGKRFEELQGLCSANMVRGHKQDMGYHHVREIDVSVQGLSANDACRALVTLAQSLNIELEIGFMWRDKEGAAHPGKRGRLKVPTRDEGAASNEIAPSSRRG